MKYQAQIGEGCFRQGYSVELFGRGKEFATSQKFVVTNWLGKKCLGELKQD